MQVRKKRTYVHLMMGTLEELEGGRGEQIISSEAAAALLHVSDAGLRIIVGRGDLDPVAKVGKGFFYRISDVERLAKDRK